MNKERVKDFGFLIIGVFMFLLVLKSGVALTDWEVYMQTNDANWYFGTGSQTFFTDYVFATGEARDVLTGDMDGDGKYEIVVYDSGYDIWWLFNQTLEFQGYVTVPGASDYDFTESISLYDIDNDAKDEIVTLGRNTSNSKAKFFILNWDGLNASSVWDSEQLSNDGKVPPVCDLSYCYFVDYNNVVYKYSISSKAIVDTLSIGGNGEKLRYLLKEDCSDHYSGDDLLFLGDFDGDNIYGEYVIVDLSTLNNYDLYNYDYTEDGTLTMHPAIDCGTFDGKDYVISTGKVPVYSQLKGKLFIDEIQSNGSAIHVEKSMYSYGTDSQLLSVTNALFVDTDLDANYETCYAVTSKLSSSSSAHQQIKCYNLSTGTNTLSKNNGFSTTTTTNFLTTGLYYGDFDNNGYGDLLIGNHYLENMNTFTSLSGWSYGYPPSYAFTNNGAECLSLYTNDGTYLRGRFSEDLSCDYEGYEITAGMPYFTDITYSDTAIDINTEDTISVDATATDSESDDIYWAYTCDYSGESDPVRTSEEYMDSGTNTTELKIRFNIDPTYCNESYDNVYEVDGLIGYAWNITASDCLTAFYRNATSGVGLSSNLITTHFIADSDGLFSSEYDGLFIGARDSLGTFLWGLHINYNESATDYNEIYRMDATGDFHFITSNDDIEDRILVDTNLDTQEYRIRIDEDLDGSIDYTSTWWSLLNPVHNTYHDTYFFTTSATVDETNDFYDLSITVPTGQMWLDTLYVEYTDLPLYSVSPSTTFDFDCVYTGIGTYEIRTWVTDDNHPNNYSVYESQSILVSQGTTPPSVSCSGYSPPSCTGTCYFLDNWNTNYSISCIGWEGADAKFPYNYGMRVEQTDMNGLSIYLPYSHTDSGVPIYAEEYDTFVIDFDFLVHDKNYRTSFIVYDSSITNTLIYAYWEDENFYVIGSGGIQNLFSYIEGSLSNIEMIVDFRDQEVTYVLDDDSGDAKTVSFYDSGVEDAGYYYFSPVDFNDADMTVDNFLISYGDANPEFDGAIEEETDYVYNPDIFCGINWTRDPKPQYIHSTCEDRGWASDSYRSFFCLPRACLQDTGYAIKNWFINNLFMAIIVILLFILVVPVVVQWRKNK